VARQISKAYIQLIHVSKSFERLNVLDDVSFGVLPGETFCILGRSGVGKSVCLRLMMGFLKPDHGRIITAGQDITDYSEDDLLHVHRKVTMVFQNGALFDSLTVRENVAYPLRERGGMGEEQIRGSVNQLLETVGAADVGDLLPAEISTGMKRSVAIARALAANPEAVLYDEPTTMVDPLTSRRLGDLIRNLKFRLKLTSVVVTHDMRLVERIADYIIFLDQARIIFSGTFSEMQQSREKLVQEFLLLDLMDLLQAAPDQRRAA
jgi:phospholipid/cholesterol/gamma-HCH transport system ATP-binding protein